MRKSNYKYMLKALADYHIFLEGTLLKPNLVTSGLKADTQVSLIVNLNVQISAILFRLAWSIL